MEENKDKQSSKDKGAPQRFSYIDLRDITL